VKSKTLALETTEKEKSENSTGKNKLETKELGEDSPDKEGTITKNSLQIPSLQINATAYKSNHIRRRSVRVVRRLSQLIKLTEKNDAKTGDQNLLKIASVLTSE
jgi:hypothetical protein